MNFQHTSKILMWKNVCPDEGEKKFVEWIKKLIDTQNYKILTIIIKIEKLQKINQK